MGSNAQDVPTGPIDWDFEGKDDKFFPIAVVGLGCRFPGNVNSTKDFEKVMEEDIYVVKDIPEDRWDLDRYYHPDPHHVGTHCNRKAGLLENVHDFDHTFFNTSPREAANTDVQQRHLLEVTQEALDDAGQPSEKLPRNTGVYIGLGLMDHGFTYLEDAKCMNAYSHTGTAHSVSANRVCFAYDLRGPSVAIDTACAASLTAMHYASFGIWNKECPMAIVGGCNTIISPEVCVGFSALGVLSPEGISCPFSANAKGYVRSEGVGACLLKPLSTALKDGDNVYCVIRGTWLGHSGYSLSITMPSSDAQTDLMKRTYPMFGLNKNNVDFIEAHGTGTPVGDPLEAEAIARAFTIDNPERKKPLPVGSSKSHFGHLECGAGMVQLLKVALMLKNRVIYPNINFGKMNPAIDGEAWNIYVPEKLVPFEEEKTYTIGVNTFGFGGALAHMVLEEFKPPAGYGQHKNGSAGWKIGGDDKKGLKILIPLTAKTGAALKATAKVWQEYERDEDAQEVVCWLSSRRSHYNSRLLVLADSGEDFRNKLQMYQEKISHDEIIEIQMPNHQEKKSLCFVFPGQGQQSFEMGRVLYRDEPVFRKAIDDCDAVYRKITGESFLETHNMFCALEPGKEYDTDSANNILVSQPAILFLHIGLIHLLKHWGIKPDCVVGHSLGEVSAAYACGSITLESAIIVQYYRATQQDLLAGTGSMAALRVTQEEGAEICKATTDLYVACVNAPRSITMAGGIQKVKDLCASNPDNAKELRVKCAFHTPHMEPIHNDFVKLMEGKMEGQKPHLCSMYSTVTGTGKPHDQETDTKYFWDNIREPVHFLEAVQGIMRDYENIVFVEVSGAATLLSSIRAIAKEEGVQPAGMVSIGQRGRDDRLSALKALTSLYGLGLELNWANVNGDCGHWMQLPKYAWQHQTFRYEAELHRSRRLNIEDRSLKGYNGTVMLEKLQYYTDCLINGNIVFPKSGFLEYAMEMEFDEGALPVLRNVAFNEDNLLLPEEYDLNGVQPDRKVLSIAKESIKMGRKVSVVCDDRVYADMEIHSGEEKVESQKVDIAAIIARCTKHMTGEDFYAKFSEMGVQYEDECKFKNVKLAHIGDGEALASLHPFVDKFQRLHVCTLDAGFMVTMAALTNNTTLMTPMKIDSLKMHVAQVPQKQSLMVHARLTGANTWGITGDFAIMDEEGNVLVEVNGFSAENRTTIKTNIDYDSCLYTTEWQPVESCMPPTETVMAYFKEQNLRNMYPEEMKLVQNAEEHLPQVMEVAITYAKHAVANVSESEVHSKNERYYKRLVQMAETLPTNLKFKDIPHVTERLIQECPESRQELQMMRRMGDLLPESLRDPKVAMAELFQEDMMKDYFLDSVSTRIFYKSIADNVRLACLEAKKKKQIVRVIEIGGRLGGLSEYILTAIEDLLKEGSVEYTFTDINIAFFHMVEERLQRFPNVKFQQLDVERDIVTQTFTPNAYDLVVCLDTLHCTRDSIESCSMIRDLLCKDGWLMVMEATHSENISEIIFGAFELCWIFEDQRKDRCWVNQSGWKNVLQQSGFSDIVAVSTPKELYHSLIIGRKTNMNLMYPEIKARSDEDQMIIEPTEKPMWVLVHMGDYAIPIAFKLKFPRTAKVVNVDEFIKMTNALALYDGILNIVFFWNDKDSDLIETLKVVKACKELGDRPSSKLWAITEDGAMDGKSLAGGMAIGFLRSAMSAITNMAGFIVDLEKGSLKDNIQGLLSVFESHTHNNTEVAIRKKTTYVRRVIQRPEILSTENIPSNDWKVEAGPIREHFSDLEMRQMKTSPLRINEVRIKIEAVGISSDEVELINSEARSDALRPGKVCSGSIEAVGEEVKDFKVTDRVVVFADGCMASHVDVDPRFVFKCPQNVSVSDFAASCSAYTTAYHALVDRANLGSDDTLLVMAASESTGLAAIALAKQFGANVICAVDSESKKKFVESTYALKNVLDATSVTFNQQIMTLTDNCGADVVLNAASGNDTMEIGMKCLARNGRFCQVTQTSFHNSQVAMDALFNNCSLHSISQNTLMERLGAFRSTVNSVITMLGKGQLKPLPKVLHEVANFKDVLNNMRDDITHGSLVFEVPTMFKPAKLEPAEELFKSKATYMITGATGGIGNEMVRWMAEKGARHITSVSSKGCNTWFDTDMVNYIQGLGASFVDVKLDLCDDKALRQTFTDLLQNGSPPLKGIFHLAGTHDEGQLEDLSPETLKISIQTKVKSVQIINDILANTPEIELDHFVMMSSSKVIWGPPTLTSFCAASSGLDALAVSRKMQGLPALSIQAGWIRGAGMLEDRERAESLKAYTKRTSLHIREFLAILHKILNKDLPPVIAVTNENWDAAVGFTQNRLTMDHLTVPGGKKGGDSDLSLEDLQSKIADKIANLLMMSPEDINVDQPMVQYGVDSLISLDITNWLRKEFNIIINQMEILEGMTTSAIIQSIAQE